MTHEEIAHLLSYICYNPNNNEREMYATQLFVEKSVLPGDCTGYTRPEIEKYIIEFLDEHLERAGG